METITENLRWNNSENYTPGDYIKYRGYTGRVLEQIHQYIKTDIPGAGWINVITEGKNTVRGVPTTCKRCKNSYGYSATPLYCNKSHNSVLPDDSCIHWES